MKEKRISFQWKKKTVAFQVYIRPKSKIQYCSWCKEQNIWEQAVFWSSALLPHSYSRGCGPELHSSVSGLIVVAACSKQGRVGWELYLGPSKSRCWGLPILTSLFVFLTLCRSSSVAKPQLTAAGGILRGSTSLWSPEKRGNESKPRTSATKPVSEQKEWYSPCSPLQSEAWSSNGDSPVQWFCDLLSSHDCSKCWYTSVRS